jgi:hypothetical protein
VDLMQKTQRALCKHLDTHAAHAQSLYVQLNDAERRAIAKAADDCQSGLCSHELATQEIEAVWTNSCERREKEAAALAAQAMAEPAAHAGVAPAEAVTDSPVEDDDTVELDAE